MLGRQEEKLSQKSGRMGLFNAACAVFGFVEGIVSPSCALYMCTPVNACNYPSFFFLLSL